MQFSLRQLLLVFPAFLLAWGVGGLLHPHAIALVHPREISEIDMLRSYTRDLISYKIIYEEHLPKSFYTGNLKRDQEIQNLFGSWRLDPQTKLPLDDWGRPLHIRYNVQNDDGEIDEIGLYSCGQDGVSLTEGNDPDDLSSWSFKGLNFYSRQRQQEKIIAALWHALWLTPIIYGMFYGMYYLIRGKRKGSIPTTPQNGIHALDDDA